MTQNENDLLPHLKHQLNLMQKEKDRLLTLIDTLEKTIASTERKMTMTTEEKFKGFTFKDNDKYKQAATEKYGEKSDERSRSKTKKAKKKSLQTASTRSGSLLRIISKKAFQQQLLKTWT